ncbi:hypothetical protein PGT21_013057 [Puccinia graminis f. sp. tritici]|uniref:Uncharacterized protein n=1 Tax=Puccinia graminis f. sp. tritici TaxID=56615 RepID=A0A5B0LYH6_PUCGR|nr:hypothetical protein PGT21_013057 [Puccinia graminis f. sp. tritici]
MTYGYGYGYGFTLAYHNPLVSGAGGPARRGRLAKRASERGAWEVGCPARLCGSRFQGILIRILTKSLISSLDHLLREGGVNF